MTKSTTISGTHIGLWLLIPEVMRLIGREFGLMTPSQLIWSNHNPRRRPHDPPAAVVEDYHMPPYHLGEMRYGRHVYDCNDNFT